MSNHRLSPAVHRRALRFQRDERTGGELYRRIGLRQTDPGNRAALLQLAEVEQGHYNTWKGYTGRDVPVSRLKLLWYTAVSYLLGFTFTIKLMERKEGFTRRDLRLVEAEIPDIRSLIYADEGDEAPLLELFDEERLHYVGAMVLGLNDALVELTGTLAGLTFALADTRLVALSGIVTGTAATLSMAASNYLAERAEGSAKALKSSLYTGAAYLVTVVLMVLPYLIMPSSLYLAAFGVMLAVVILIIVAFNYYISVARSQPFFQRFAEMAAISLGVAFISFIIGLMAKALLGVDI